MLDRTEGVTASFLEELLRRAALLAAARDGGALRVSAGDLSSALDELLDTGNAMTRVLLGAGPPRGADRGTGLAEGEPLDLAEPGLAPFDA